MPRIARGNLEQGFFHVLNRGNHRQMLFRQQEDFAVFLEVLSQSVLKFEVKLWSYCLMGNHWHLVAEVAAVKELSRWMHWVCNRHVKLWHCQHRSVGGGHIYQGRYKSFPIQDESYMYEVMRYVEANPLRAKLVARAEDWSWSSLSVATVRHGLLEVARPKLQGWARDAHWHATVNQPLGLEQLDALRQCVVRGAPRGEPGWSAALVAQAGMESTVRPRGRPRKPRFAA